MVFLLDAVNFGGNENNRLGSENNKKVRPDFRILMLTRIGVFS